MTFKVENGIITLIGLKLNLQHSRTWVREEIVILTNNKKYVRKENTQNLLSSEISSRLSSVIQGVFMLLCLQNCPVNGSKFLSDKRQIYLGRKIDTSFALVFLSPISLTLNREHDKLISWEVEV